jgi:glycerol-3-phosphate acyltransferase PlsY
MDVLKIAAVMVCAYFLGAIPFGYIIGRLKGINIREHGSGNIGFTNVWRVLGFKIGLVVLFCDGLKGWMSCFIGFQLYGEVGALIGGIVAILGHSFSCFIGFKGGKGIATGGGMLLFMSPPTLLVLISMVALVCVTIRYMSVGSILAALLAPFMLYVFDASMVYVFGIIPAAAYVIYLHIPNMKRLMNGTENKLTFGKKN